MNDDEAKRYIAEHVKVPRLHVTIAKGFILKNFHPTTSELINRFLQSVEAKMPQKLVLHPSVDPIPTLDSVVSAISWQLAACEAIWGLIANAAVFPASTNMYGALGSLQWTTVVPGSGGSSSGFSLEEYSIQVPDKLALPKSSNPDVDLPLTDPDLYLKELNLPGLVPAVETALREAVQCIRHGLYLACLAMLGRASEAAWIETGLALASAVPAGSSIDGTKIGDQLCRHWQKDKNRPRLILSPRGFRWHHQGERSQASGSEELRCVGRLCARVQKFDPLRGRTGDVQFLCKSCYTSDWRRASHSASGRSYRRRTKEFVA